MLPLRTEATPLANTFGEGSIEQRSAEAFTVPRPTAAP